MEPVTALHQIELSIPAPVECEHTYKIVVVKWTDSVQINSGWMTRDEIQELIEQPEPVITTAGVLFYECDTSIVVVSSAHPEQFLGVVRIPRGCVDSMEVVGEVEL